MGTRREPQKQRWSNLSVVCVVVCLIGFASIVTAQKRRTSRPAAAKAPSIDYAKFSHTTHTVNQPIECKTCHTFPTKNWKDVRKGDEAFADVAEFPEHSACLDCHRQQFFARERPAPRICSNCHIAVTPRDTARYVFPSLGEPFLSSPHAQQFVSEFQVVFPHDKHVDVVGANRLRSRAPKFITAGFRFKTRVTQEPKSCPVCHQTYKPLGDSTEEYVTKPPTDLGDGFWLKKGTFKNSPVNHSACFTCHSDDSGIPPAPADCGACHKLFTRPPEKTDFDSALLARMKLSDWFIARTWARRGRSAGYPHEGGGHADLNCTTCHNPATMNLLQPNSMRVTVASCGGAEGCHVTPTLDDGGALNFEVDEKKKNASFRCTKCHLKLGSEPIPPAHEAAVVAAKKK